MAQHQNFGKTVTTKLAQAENHAVESSRPLTLIMAVSPKHFQVLSAFTLPPSSSFSSTIPSSPLSVTASTIRVSTKFCSVGVCFSRRSIVRYNDHAGEDEEGSDEEEEEDWSFEEAVTLFNQRDYYKSHDALEALWIQAEEPTRTLIHGILQCAVGFHHLFNNVYLSPFLYLFLILSFVFIHIRVNQMSLVLNSRTIKER